MVLLSFTFMEYGKPLTPQIAADTQSQSTLSGFAAMAAAAQSWAIAVTEDVHTALGDAEITSTLQSFTSIANTVATTATSLVSMVGMLPGQYGRFVGQTVADAQKTASSVEELAGIGASGRDGVSAACAAALGAATGGDYVSSALAQAVTSAAAGSPQTAATDVLSGADVVDIATGVQAIVQAVVAANPDSAAQVQACLALAAFPATGQPSAEQSAVNADVSTLCRRMALAAAAQASALYLPTSQQDAASLRDEIVTLIQAEMLIAGDAGDDTSYIALEALRSSVATDLAARGASLPKSIPVTFAASLPSLLLAQRLYQDQTRSDELVQEANPVSPLFMPQSFSALAS
jgi:prophage DNA circulation protein